MSNFETKFAYNPIKVTVTRLDDIFKKTNILPVSNDNIIKNYIYSNEKRIIV